MNVSKCIENAARTSSLNSIVLVMVAIFNDLGEPRHRGEATARTIDALLGPSGVRGGGAGATRVRHRARAQRERR